MTEGNWVYAIRTEYRALCKAKEKRKAGRCKLRFLQWKRYPYALSAPLKNDGPNESSTGHPVPDLGYLLAGLALLCLAWLGLPLYPHKWTAGLVHEERERFWWWGDTLIRPGLGWLVGQVVRPARSLQSKQQWHRSGLCSE